MPNPKLETYKNKATGTVYDYTDAAAQAALADILDGTDISSFEDVETALATKVDKVTGKGLSTNDYDDTEKAKVAGAFPRSEQAVLGAKNQNLTKYKSETKNGVTWTVNADNSVSILGRTSASETEVIPTSFEAPFTGQVKFCGGISNECHIYPWSFTDNARPYIDSTKTARQTGTSKAIDDTLPIYIEKGKRYALIPRIIGNNLDVSGTFYPLLVLDSETDLSYVAPAMTNRDLARYRGHSSAYNDNVTKITITEDIGTIGVDSVLLLFIRHYTSATTFIIREAYVNFYMDGTLKSGISMLHDDNSLPTITKVEQTNAGLEITFSAPVYATVGVLRLI